MTGPVSLLKAGTTKFTASHTIMVLTHIFSFNILLFLLNGDHHWDRSEYGLNDATIN